MNDWTLTREDNKESLTFPADFRWIDEHDWSAATASDPQYSLSGSLIVHTGKKQAGRPITLEGDWVWHKRATADTLRGWADIPALTLRLTHPDGREFRTVFRLHEGSFGAASPVRYCVPENDAEQYLLEVRLMTV